MDPHFVYVAALNLCFFCAGWVFFSRVLYKEYEVNNLFVQLIFCCVLVLSCSMFELIIFEIVGILEHDTRWLNWKFDLISILVLLVFIIPFYIFYLILRDYVSGRRWATPMASGALLIFLYFFWTIGDPFPILTKSHGIFSIEQGISRIAIVGTWVMAVLSGYGAVSCPFNFISGFLRKIDDQEVSDLSLRLPVVLQQITQKKRWILCRRVELETKRHNSQDRGGTSFGRRALDWIPGVRAVVNKLVPSSDAATEQRIASLHTEVRGLEALSVELFLEVNELLEYRERIAYSRTLEGRAFNVAGYGFAVYCMYKVVMTTINIILRRVGKIDPISRGIWIVNIVLACIEDGGFQHCLSDTRPSSSGNQIDEEFWSQTLSFAITGCLIFATIRGFMKNFVMRMFQDFSSGATANIIILLLVETMGMYFVSAVVLMRMNMPIRYRAIITDVLGDIHFNFYQRWFDLIFWISSMVTIGWMVYHQHKMSNRVKMDKC